MLENTPHQFADMIGWLLYAIFNFIYNLFDGYLLFLVAVMIALVIGVIYLMITKAMRETFDK